MMIKKVILTILIIPSFVLAAAFILATTPTEKLYELDAEIFKLVETSNTCITLMNGLNKKAKQIEQCKNSLKIDKRDIDRLQNKFNKQLSRYKEKKDKLTDQERYWAQEYVLKIKERTEKFAINIKTIHGK